ncbi:hypothetical protein F5050DRAFT_1711122 [Lentinula boryana]|uniref:Uncharacterized protein n=1 Tax=Lentinula boryana TaxID=40481 RepID=A0ABQ8QGT4_9AGAR|nr:hypothetical protein F5050DRAFT_1711122 [Lentinula boryana]
MYDNEEGRRDRASILDTPTCEGRVGILARMNTNTLGFLARKGRHPRKDEYKTIGFLARKGRASQRRKHGLLARGGKWALSAVGITAARDTQLIGRTGAHNLLKYWGLERFGND